MLPCLLLLSGTLRTAAALPAPVQLDMLHGGYIDAMIDVGEQGERVMQAALRLAQALNQDDGSWSDLSYQTDGLDGRSWWSCGEHLQRMVLLATAQRAAAPQAPSRNSTSAAAAAAAAAVNTVRNAALLATQHWLHNNYINSNWWWNDFGTPRSLLKTLLLLGGKANSAADPKVEVLVQHPNTSVIVGRCTDGTYTGTNLVWASTAHIMRAILLEPSIPTAVANVTLALDKLYSTARSYAQAEDGLQSDGSWHQHGPFLYSGWGYGAIWSQHMMFYGNLTHGLPLFAMPPLAVAGMQSMLLDGQRWMSRGPNFDPTTCGRLVTYFGNWSGPEHLNHGHYHYYAAFTAFPMAFPDFYTPLPLDASSRAFAGNGNDSVGAVQQQHTPISIGFGNYLNTPFTRSTPRGSEFEAWRATLNNATADTLSGNKVFYDSDYVVHRRPHFSLTVRMSSTRTIQSECVNEEGKQNRNMADGTTMAFVTGREFEDIFPVWDWHQVPGTVEVTGSTSPDLQWTCSNSNGRRGKGHFAGGVSDGTDGMAAFDYYSDLDIRLHRAWFFFGNFTVVFGVGNCCGAGAGAGIKVGDSSAAVAMDIDGNVTVSLDQRLLTTVDSEGGPSHAAVVAGGAAGGPGGKARVVPFSNEGGDDAWHHLAAAEADLIRTGWSDGSSTNTNTTTTTSDSDKDAFRGGGEGGSNNPLGDEEEVGWVYNGGGMAFSWKANGSSNSSIRSSNRGNRGAGVAAVPQVFAFVGNRNGTWARITQTNDTTEVVKPVFAAKINLGPVSSARSLQYAYTMYPGVQGADEVPAAVAAASATERGRINSWGVQAVCFSTSATSTSTARVVVMAALYYTNVVASIVGCPDLSIVSSNASHGLLVMGATSTATIDTPSTSSSTSLLLHVSDPHLASGVAMIVVGGVWHGDQCQPLNATHSSVAVELPGGNDVGSTVSASCTSVGHE